MPIPTLSLDKLTLSKERTYFTLVAVVAAMVWLLVTITIIGVFYGALIALFIWFGHGLVIAHLKAESVLVTEEQMPVLYATYMGVVSSLQIAEAPPLYIVQAGGVINAFATRRGARNFVVVYSDMLEACGDDSPQIRFILGHELGHVRSQHVKKKMFLLPGLLTPLLGTAYSRACESSCDRHGAFAAGDMRAAAQSMLILSGGRNAWQQMDPEAFSRQYQQERGFFVSWHELTSGYPTLSQRAYNLLTLDSGKEPVSAARHPLAYFFALFFAGGRGGSGFNLLVTVGIVAFWISIALPAFNRAKKQAQAARQTVELQQIQQDSAPGIAAAATTAIEATYTSALDANRQPVDDRTEFPADMPRMFAVVHWTVPPGQHALSFRFEEVSSHLVVHTRNHPFMARLPSGITTVSFSTADFRPRPMQVATTVSLDGGVVSTKQLTFY